MPELSLSTSYSIFVLLVSAVAAGALSYFSYRTTVPPVPPRRRVILMTLRAAGLFAVFFLIGTPLISLLTRTEQPPETVVLIDNSRSMTLRDRQGDRAAELRSLLQKPALQNLGATRFALFDARTRFLSSFSPDSVTLTGAKTDIAAALRTVQQQAEGENIQGIVLISDGNATNGSSPLFETENLHIPIFTVGIGDTSQQRDLAVRNVLTNAVVYAGSRVPANVTIRSSGFTNQRIEVTLMKGSAVIDRQFLTLQEGTREYPVVLHFTPEGEGTQKYVVRISRLPDEVTDQNNRFSFFTKVLKSKMNVLLLAGAPGPDLAFIRRSLEHDKTIGLSAFVEQRDGSFYERALSSDDVQKADCIVLVGFPGPASRTSTVTRIADAAAGGKPLLFVETRTVDFSKLAVLAPELPFTTASRAGPEIQAFLQLQEAARLNPILKVSESQGQDPWSALPPLFKIQNAVRAKPESQVLAVAKIQNVVTSEPLLITRTVNHRRSVAVLGYGLWRWKMQSETSPPLLETFLGNTVRWLTTRDDDRRVKIAPVKESFTSQEPAEFSGQVYDESMQPVDNAVVTLSVRRGNETSDVTMNSVGHGQYEGRLEGLQEGDYQYRGVARAGSTVLGQDAGTFSIGGLNVEFQNTRTNALLLRQLAQRTGGSFLEPDQVDRLPGAIRSLANARPREVVHASEYELWNIQWSLLVIILLFSLEWLLRKRSGML